MSAWQREGGHRNVNMHVHHIIHQDHTPLVNQHLHLGFSMTQHLNLGNRGNDYTIKKRRIINYPAFFYLAKLGGRDISHIKGF
jgi:hypothetical protein